MEDLLVRIKQFEGDLLKFVEGKKKEILENKEKLKELGEYKDLHCNATRQQNGYLKDEIEEIEDCLKKLYERVPELKEESKKYDYLRYVLEQHELKKKIKSF